MSAGLILVVAVIAGYLAAHAASEWLARRYLIVSGAEYLLLGILMGPEVSGLIRASVVASFAPFLTLALGWIGAMIGTQLYLPRLIGIRGAIYRVAFFEAIATMAVVAGVMTWLFAIIFDTPIQNTLVPGITLGAIGTASSSMGISLVSNRMGKRGSMLRQLEVTALVDATVAIATFSILLCLNHPAPPADVRAPTPTEWSVISISIGIVGGALFHLFLGSQQQIDRLFISMVGAVILASGAAAYLRLSPLLPCLLIGMILVNTSRNRETIVKVMDDVARPFYFVLLIFAGAAWRPSTQALWLVPVIAFLLLRYVAKIGSARLAARANGRLRTLGPNWGRALLGHGAVGVAIATNYLLHDASLLPNVVFTAAMASVLLTDFFGGHLAQSALRDQFRRATERFSRLADLLEPLKPK